MFVPSQFEDINQDIHAQLRQNLVVTDWEKLGNEAHEFEPYFTIPITADTESMHSFYPGNKYYKFAAEWIKENFPNGLPSIPDGYMYRITWMPSYTIRSDATDGTSKALADYEDDFKTSWHPTLTALSHDEDQFPWFYVWNDKHSWVEGPSFISPIWLEKYGIDPSSKQMSHKTFCSFDWIIFMYKMMNLYPHWWDIDT